MTKKDKLKLMCTLLVPFSEHAAKTYASEEAFDDYARGAIEKVDRVLERAAKRCGVAFTDDEPPTSHEIYREIERQAIRSVEQREQEVSGPSAEVDKEFAADFSGEPLVEAVVEAFKKVIGYRLPVRRCSLCHTFMDIVVAPHPTAGKYVVFDSSCSCASHTSTPGPEEQESDGDVAELVRRFPEEHQRNLLEILRNPDSSTAERVRLRTELCNYLVAKGYG